MSTAASHDPGDDLGRRLSTAVVLFHQAVAARVGLSAADLKTLDLIARDGPSSASELAERTGLTPAAVTSLVGRLAHGGHVVRETDPADRRRAVIRATEPLHPELAAAYGDLGAGMGRLFTRYSAPEQAAIVDYLDRMVTVLEEQTRQVRSTSAGSTPAG